MKRPFHNRVLRLTAGTVALGVLAACGGGGGGSNVDVADGGIRGTGSSVGPVSGFGSVFVNGVEFSTDQVVVGDDGISRESQLNVGMILRVDGQWRTNGRGDAETVEYDDTLRGPMTVGSVWDPVTRTASIRILGQTVRIDSQTVLSGTVVEDLQSFDGAFVRMSGWRLPSGEFRASFLGLRSQANTDIFDERDKVELEGVIDQITSEELFIGTQRVNYSGAIFDGLEADDLGVGAAVEVEGYLVGEVLMADEVRPDDLRRYGASEEEDIEFVGPVSAAYSETNGTVSVNGILVRITQDTEFDGINGPNDLLEGLLVQVEGDFEADGSVTAEEIELREADSAVQGGPAQEVDIAQRQFKLGGVLVQITPLTIITDDDDDRRLSLTDLAGQVELEIEGIERAGDNGSTYLEALKIERENDDPEGTFELVGRISEMVNDRIRVLDVDLFVSGNTEFDEISQLELQALVDQGLRPRVEVEYAFIGTQFVIEEIELEENDDD